MQIEEFKLERFFAKYEFIAPYLLCSSDPESFSIEELLSLEPNSLEGFKKQWLGYTETQGSPELRNEFIENHNKSYTDTKVWCKYDGCIFEVSLKTLKDELDRRKKEEKK